MRIDIWIRLEIAILCGLIFVGCAEEQKVEEYKPYKILVKDQALFFDGQMLGSAADDLQQQIDLKSEGKITRLIIRSPGGKVDVGVEMANLVKDNRLDVEVVDYCVSSCADLFLAGNRKILSPKSIVVFHTSMLVVHDLLINSEIPEAGPIFSTVAEDERALYKRLGLDDTLLMGSIDGMVPVCFIEITAKPKNDPDRYGISYTYAAWLPSLGLLKAAGVENIEGFWPKDTVEVRQRSSRHFNEAFTINYIEADWRESKPTPKLKRCGTKHTEVLH